MNNRYGVSTVLLFLASLLVVFYLAGCQAPPPRSPRPPYRPPQSHVPPPSAKGLRYTIQKGDSFYSVARKFSVDWRDIVEANPLLDPHNLEVGQVIVIPGVDKYPAPAAARPLAEFNPGYPGPLPAEDSFVWPLRGNILSRFGAAVPWRMGTANHGIDIEAEPGDIVVAAKSGRVCTFDNVYGYGRVVVLEHRDGTTTFYGHLDMILVKHDRWVKQGERIGTAGSDGLAKGTELHFRIMRGEELVNPLLLLPK